MAILPPFIDDHSASNQLAHDDKDTVCKVHVRRLKKIAFFRRMGPEALLFDGAIL